MIARVVLLIFFGIVLIQAKSLDGQTKFTSPAKIQKLMARASKMVTAHVNARDAAFRSQFNDSVPQPELTDEERNAAMQAYIGSTSERISKLIQDVAQLTKSLINSSTKMIISVLNSTSNIMAADVKTLQPLMRNISEGLQALKPPSETYYVIKRKSEHVHHENKSVNNTGNKTP